MKLLYSFVLACAASAVVVKEQLPLHDGDERPNIVVILTDDQDLHMDSVSYMPLLKKHIIDEGTFFKSHYCTTAICCPSRVTLWTGRNAHNTNVTDVFPPYGGYPKFISQGWNENWLPVWLQSAGYSTYYTGKLFNAHTVDNWNSPHPKGWTSSDFLLDPHTYQYLNATFQRNDQAPVSHEGEYSTDILAEKAYGLLEEGINSKKPFFLGIAPVAPHSNVNANTFVEPGKDIQHGKVLMTAPVPAKRHEHLFPDAKVPRTANFNPDKPSGASWISRLGKLNSTQIEYNDDFYRRRLQALQAVDEIIEGVITRLSDHGILDNTYIIYTTDNGYHISQHRLPPGKECAFEEDINVPLVIRGPGVPVKSETGVVTAHTDLAPTILGIAGAKEGWEGLDGRAVPLSGEQFGIAVKARREHVNVEFWGIGIPEGKFQYSLDDGKVVAYGANNTYKALRVVGEEYNLLYTVWCSNEHELYDLKTDPGQLHNLYPTSGLSLEVSILEAPLSKVLPRLDALLMITKSCKGQTCVDPWSVIHPAGNVKTLADALSTRFDGFYASISDTVSFDRCELGYILDAEGPQSTSVFLDDIKEDEL